MRDCERTFLSSCMIGRLVTKFAYFWRNSTYNFIGQNLISSRMMSLIILWSLARYFNRFDWLNWIGRSFLLIGQKISNRSVMRKKPYGAWRMLAFAPGRGGISTKFDRVVVIFKTGSTAFCVLWSAHTWDKPWKSVRRLSRRYGVKKPHSGLVQVRFELRGAISDPFPLFWSFGFCPLPVFYYMRQILFHSLSFSL